MVPSGKEAISEQEWTRIRLAAVAKQIVDRGIRDPKVLAAMREIPRHRFLPPNVADALAYADRPLPIGTGQTMSQPYIIAYIAEKLAMKGDEMVLEVGTGPGYQAAVLSKLSKEVISLEIEQDLVKMAQANLKKTQIDNVEVVARDGFKGYMECAPYDRIVLAAAVSDVPQELLNQLSCPGKLIAPIGGKTRQMLTLFEKELDPASKTPKLSKKLLLPVVFVQMRG